MVTALPPSEYPRVLVFGAGFDSYSGGGITLSNLFRGWPVSRLAVVDPVARVGTAAVAGAEYRLGTLEQRWAWPLSYVPRRSKPSGSIDHSNHSVAQAPVGDLHGEQVAADAQTSARRAAHAAFHWVTSRLGSDEVLQRVTVSEPLRAWAR